MGVGAAVGRGAMGPRGGVALTAMEGSGGGEGTPTLVVGVIDRGAEGARSRDEPATR